MTRIPLATSPLAAVLLRWAHGAEPELRVGDVLRLHDDVEELLCSAGVPTSDVQRVCGCEPPSWMDGAADGACDVGTKSDAVQRLAPGTASQERGTS